MNSIDFSNPKQNLLNSSNFFSFNQPIDFLSTEWDQVPPIVKSSIEKLYSLYQSNNKQNSQISEINSKISKLQSQLDSKLSKDHLEGMEREIFLLKTEMNNKVSKDMLQSSLNKKANRNEFEALENEFKLNENLKEELNQYKNENFEQMNNLNSKVKIIDTDVDQLVSDIKNRFTEINKNINEISKDKKFDQKALEDFQKNIEDKIMEENNSNNQSLLEKFSKFKTDILLFNQNLLEEMRNENKNKKLEEAFFSFKFDTENSLNEIKTEIQQLFGNLNMLSNIGNNSNINPNNTQNPNDYNYLEKLRQEIMQKVSISDFVKSLQNKVDYNTFKSLLDDKLSLVDFENNSLVHRNEINMDIEKLKDELSYRVTIEKFENIISEIHSILTSIKDSLIMKVDIKELKEYLDSVASLTDLDKIAENLNSKLDLKLNSDVFEKNIVHQSGINKIISQDNVMAKYLWFDNRFSNCCIHFNKQIVNTAEDNFYAEKDNIFLIVREKGLYYIKFILFIDEEQQDLNSSSKNRPTIQLLVDNKSVVADFYGIGEVERKGNLTLSRLLYESKEERGNLNNCTVGYHYSEYLELKDKARISIAIVPCSNILKARGILTIKSV
ncbi:MAG: hypothetical protein MJ252_16550 [archaeon]|nr:hypothetical protein [archaeon]